MIDPKLPRRERDKLRQRQEILSAALELFSQKGYHNVSVQEIASQAEFAIGTLYKFFQNKEELYRALVLEQCEDFEIFLDRALAAGDDEVAKLENYIRAKGDWCRRHLPFVRLYLAESRGAGFNLLANLNDELRQRYYAFMEKLAAIFAAGIQGKRFKNIGDPFFLAVSLDSIVDASLLLWLDAPERYPYPEDPDAILTIFFRGLLEK